MRFPNFGFTLVRAHELKALRDAAAGRAGRSGDAPQPGPESEQAPLVASDPGPVPGSGGTPTAAGTGHDGQPAVVRELIRLADGLSDLITQAETSGQLTVDTVLRWVGVRTESLLIACDIVQILDADGFDPARHQSVAGRPAPCPQQTGRIAETVRPGYAWKGALLRPQQVIVYTTGT